MSPGIDLNKRAIEAFEQRTEERVKEIALTIFVCGPAELDGDGKPSTRPGAVVRRTITQKVGELGHSCIWGEHLSSGRGGAPLTRGFNDAHKEILFAVDDQTDLVVIFPSSQGSIAELGIFCTHEKISPKLLVVLPSERRGDKSFVVGPLRKAGKMGNAVIKFRDYENVKEIWRLVRSHIQKQVRLKAVRLTHE